jgi:multimeric flavodoxin WrbA
MESRVHVLALIGSPRKQGNTDIMADHVLSGAASAVATVSKVYLDDHLVRPIAEVADSSGQRDDPRKDDDFPALLQRFLAADIVVWSTPVYWAGPSAQMKCFLDRMSSYFNHPSYRPRFEGKSHIVLCAFGSPEPEHGKWVTEPMKLSVKYLHGTYVGDVCASVHHKGKVREMSEVLEACRDLGTRAVRAAREQADCRHSRPTAGETAADDA